jgi:ribosomal-protein-alanine N-acetyltransferase
VRRNNRHNIRSAVGYQKFPATSHFQVQLQTHFPIFLSLTATMKYEIILRPWCPEDAGQLALLANNKKIWLNVRDRFPHPYTVGNAVEWIASTKDQQPAQTLAILADGKIAGCIGVLLKEDVYRKSIEIGYFIGEAFWGKGIATTSVSLFIDYIKKHFDVLRVYAEVFEHNRASMKVLEKNDFHLESIRRRSVIKNNVIMDDHVWVKFLP